MISGAQQPRGAFSLSTTLRLICLCAFEYLSFKWWMEVKITRKGQFQSFHWAQAGIVEADSISLEFFNNICISVVDIICVRINLYFAWNRKDCCNLVRQVGISNSSRDWVNPWRGLPTQAIHKHQWGKNGDESSLTMVYGLMIIIVTSTLMTNLMLLPPEMWNQATSLWAELLR